MALYDHEINPRAWLGDNPLCLDSVKFRNQYRCIFPLECYIKSIIRIIESKGLAFVFYHMVWVPTALYLYNMI